MSISLDDMESAAESTAGAIGDAYDRAVAVRDAGIAAVEQEASALGASVQSSLPSLPTLPSAGSFFGDLANAFVEGTFWGIAVPVAAVGGLGYVTRKTWVPAVKSALRSL